MNSFQIDTLSIGKSIEHNEDFFWFNTLSVVLVDWATDKSGELYDWLTWWEIVSKFIVEKCLSCDLIWTELISFLNIQLSELYKKMWLEEKVENPLYRFSAWFICMREIWDKLIVTYLWDLWFRINWDYFYKNEKQIDIINASKRAEYIKRTWDIENSRNFITKDLIEQFKYQNVFDTHLWYWVIDGSNTPEIYVKVFSFDLITVDTLELFTDWYLCLPEKWFINIIDWEKMYHQSIIEDPFRYLKYKSTKVNDDRTIILLKKK